MVIYWVKVKTSLPKMRAYNVTQRALTYANTNQSGLLMVTYWEKVTASLPQWAYTI